MARSDVLVLGAGVSGLTTALVLAQRGHRVRVRAREGPAGTVSSVAAAIWYPYLASPRERVLPWGRRSFEVYSGMAERGEGGVRMVDVVEIHRSRQPDPWWADGLAPKRLGPGELPVPGLVSADVVRVPVIDTSTYLPWLERRLLGAGAVLETGATVRSLREVVAAADVVVHCTGLGAAQVARDRSLQPVRGQVVRVRDPGLRRAWIDDEHPAGMTYVVPRGGDCVIGGTAEPGETDLEPVPAVTDAILARASALLPELVGAEVLGTAVGLRPVRPEVRLECEWIAGIPVVHNYGHGGAGFTLAWGCAEDAADLVEEAVAGRT